MNQTSLNYKLEKFSKLHKQDQRYCSRIIYFILLLTHRAWVEKVVSIFTRGVRPFEKQKHATNLHRTSWWVGH